MLVAALLIVMPEKAACVDKVSDEPSGAVVVEVHPFAQLPDAGVTTTFVLRLIASLRAKISIDVMSKEAVLTACPRMKLTNEGTPMPSRMAVMDSVTISSTTVKPLLLTRALGCIGRRGRAEILMMAYQQLATVPVPEMLFVPSFASVSIPHCASRFACVDFGAALIV